MPLEKIYVTRHGFRSNWLVDAATGTCSAHIPSPSGIPADPALTSHGVSQARELGHHLMALDPPVEAVYSSPFYRCLRTLEPFMQLRLGKGHHDGTLGDGGAGDRILPERGIGEWFGSVPFSHPRPAATAVLKAHFPAIDEDYVSAVVPSPQGETLAQFQHRVARALRVIIQQCDARGARSAILCTHAAVVIVLGRVLTRQVPDSVDVEDFHAYTCGLSVFRRRGGTHDESPSGSESLSADSAHVNASLIGGWDCELNSDCSFLSGGQERGWRFTGDESFPGTGSRSGRRRLQAVDYKAASGGFGTLLRLA